MAAALQERPVYRATFSAAQQYRRRGSRFGRRHLEVDLAAQQFLLELADYLRNLPADSSGTVYCLLPFRGDFRSILRHQPCAGLGDFLSNSSAENPCFLVAIWLLGRCANRQLSYNIDRLPADRDANSRRHFARSLARVESWPRLRQLAADYPDDEFVTSVLSGTHTDTFDRRLTRFSKHVDQTHAAEAAVASQMPLWFRDHQWARTPPKNPGWIRRMLERIKGWVRGE